MSLKFAYDSGKPFRRLVWANKDYWVRDYESSIEPVDSIPLDWDDIFALDYILKED